MSESTISVTNQGAQQEGEQKGQTVTPTTPGLKQDDAMHRSMLIKSVDASQDQGLRDY